MATENHRPKRAYFRIHQDPSGYEVQAYLSPTYSRNVMLGRLHYTQQARQEAWLEWCKRKAKIAAIKCGHELVES